jgi:hypothetical protein
LRHVYEIENATRDAERPIVDERELLGDGLTHA